MVLPVVTSLQSYLRPWSLDTVRLPYCLSLTGERARVVVTCTCNLLLLLLLPCFPPPTP